MPNAILILKMNNKFYNFKRSSRASIRRSQVITTFGPGALVNLELGTFVGMDIDSWMNTGLSDTIYEERLQNRLRVRYFRQPPSSETFPKGIPYRRFPRWLFCPKCRVLKTYEKWVENDNRKFPTIPKCTTCINKGLVPMSFLVACRKGHLDDFPWVEWVHRGREICSPDPVLEYKTSLAGAGLAGSRIGCMQCDAKRSMQGAFSPDAFKRGCSGAKPWSKDNVKEDCTENPVTVQRGGSNVYFPKVVSSITIPPYTDPLFENIRNTNNWNALTSMTIDDPEVFATVKNSLLIKIAEQIGRTFEDVKKCVDSMERLSEDAETQSEEDYRFDEYQAFHGRYDAKTNNKRDFEITHGNKGFDYSKYGIKDIFLVKSLREVRALIGFSRLRPYDMPDMEYAGAEESIEASELVSLSDREGHSSNWKPAIEVRGEGIFLTLDNEKVTTWSRNKLVKEREVIINKNYEASCRRRHTVYKPINAKYLLLHTISHLLIRQLSFESGYSGTSLRERIYCNSSSNEKNNMEGILIYTAAGDADGTLGGLVRQARPERFPAVLDSLIETSGWCANDPLCVESKGQGFESLNLSACYACALLSETSCEEFNKFLDRVLVTGTPESPEIGFFSRK